MRLRSIVPALVVLALCAVVAGCDRRPAGPAVPAPGKKAPPEPDEAEAWANPCGLSLSEGKLRVDLQAVTK